MIAHKEKYLEAGSIERWYKEQNDPHIIYGLLPFLCFMNQWLVVITIWPVCKLETQSSSGPTLSCIPTPRAAAQRDLLGPSFHWLLPGFRHSSVLPTPIFALAHLPQPLPYSSSPGKVGVGASPPLWELFLLQNLRSQWSERAQTPKATDFGIHSQHLHLLLWVSVYSSVKWGCTHLTELLGEGEEVIRMPKICWAPPT